MIVLVYVHVHVNVLMFWLVYQCGCRREQRLRVLRNREFLESRASIIAAIEEEKKWRYVAEEEATAKAEFDEKALLTSSPDRDVLDRDDDGKLTDYPPEEKLPIGMSGQRAVIAVNTPFPSLPPGAAAVAELDARVYDKRGGVFIGFLVFLCVVSFFFAAIVRSPSSSCREGATKSGTTSSGSSALPSPSSPSSVTKRLVFVSYAL